MNLYSRILRAPDGLAEGSAPVSAPAPASAPIESIPSAPVSVAPVDNTPAPAVEVIAPAVATPAATELSAPVEAPKPSDAPEPTPASLLLDEAVKQAAEEPKADDAAKELSDPVTEAPVEPQPIEYKFQFPEGVKPESVNPELMGQYTTALSEAKVPPEMGQKFLDMHLAELQIAAKNVAQHQWDVFNRQQEQWKSEVKADPEIGGSRLVTAMRTVASVIDQYGGSPDQQIALKNVLTATGAGNNPLLLRMFHNIGKALGREASPVPAPPPSAPKMSREERGLARYSGNR